MFRFSTEPNCFLELELIPAPKISNYSEEQEQEQEQEPVSVPVPASGFQ